MPGASSDPEQQTDWAPSLRRCPPCKPTWPPCWASRTSCCRQGLAPRNALHCWRAHGGVQEAHACAWCAARRPRPSFACTPDLPLCLQCPPLQVPTLQNSIAPLLAIKADLLKVPQLAADLTQPQSNCTSCEDLQPLVGIRDQLLQVRPEQGAQHSATPGRECECGGDQSAASFRCPRSRPCMPCPQALQAPAPQAQLCGPPAALAPCRCPPFRPTLRRSWASRTTCWPCREVRLPHSCMMLHCIQSVEASAAGGDRQEQVPLAEP